MALEARIRESDYLAPSALIDTNMQLITVPDSHEFNGDLSVWRGQLTRSVDRAVLDVAMIGVTAIAAATVEKFDLAKLATFQGSDQATSLPILAGDQIGVNHVLFDLLHNVQEKEDRLPQNISTIADEVLAAAQGVSWLLKADPQKRVGDTLMASLDLQPQADFPERYTQALNTHYSPTAVSMLLTPESLTFTADVIDLRSMHNPITQESATLLFSSSGERHRAEIHADKVISRGGKSFTVPRHTYSRMRKFATLIQTATRP